MTLRARVGVSLLLALHLSAQDPALKKPWVHDDEAFARADRLVVELIHAFDACDPASCDIVRPHTHDADAKAVGWVEKVQIRALGQDRWLVSVSLQLPVSAGGILCLYRRKDGLVSLVTTSDESVFRRRSTGDEGWNEQPEILDPVCVVGTGDTWDFHVLYHHPSNADGVDRPEWVTWRLQDGRFRAVDEMTLCDCEHIGRNGLHFGDPGVRVRRTFAPDADPIQVVKTEVLDHGLDEADKLMGSLEGKVPKETVLQFMSQEQYAELQKLHCGYDPDYPPTECKDDTEVVVPIVRLDSGGQPVGKGRLRLLFCEKKDGCRLECFSVENTPEEGK